MKNARLILSAFAVFAIVGSALAFTAPYGQGSVYCDSSCQTRVNFREDPSGNANPCTGQEYILSSGICVTSSGPFSATLGGK